MARPPLPHPTFRRRAGGAAEDLPYLAAKAEEYLAAARGEAVWVLDPRRQTVTLHLPGQEPETLGRQDVLDGHPYLPGLRLRVAEIFPSQA